MRKNSFWSKDKEKNSWGYFKEALSKIKSNPDNHGYPPDEVKRIQKFGEKIREIYPEVRTQIMLEVANMLPPVKKVIMHYTFEKTRFLSEIGWYVSPRIFENFGFNDSNELLKMENVFALEKILLEEADTKIPRIIACCSEKFPERKEIFEEILQLYTLKLYRAVIMMCYAQADGMSNDTWKIGFFDKDKEYRLKTYSKFKNSDNGIISGLVQQLNVEKNEITTFSKNEIFNEEEKRKTTVNRHLVMHGHSLNYGTRENAVKAIYLLDFLYFVIGNK